MGSYGSGFTHTNSTQLNSTEPSFRFVSFLFVLRSDTDTDTTRRNQTKEEEEEGRMRRDIGSPLSSRVKSIRIESSRGRKYDDGRNTLFPRVNTTQERKGEIG